MARSPVQELGKRVHDVVGTPRRWLCFAARPIPHFVNRLGGIRGLNAEGRSRSNCHGEGVFRSLFIQ